MAIRHSSFVAAIKKYFMKSHTVQAESCYNTYRMKNVKKEEIQEVQVKYTSVGLVSNSKTN